MFFLLRTFFSRRLFFYSISFEKAFKSSLFSQINKNQGPFAGPCRYLFLQNWIFILLRGGMLSRALFAPLIKSVSALACLEEQAPMLTVRSRFCFRLIFTESFLMFSLRRPATVLVPFSVPRYFFRALSLHFRSFRSVSVRFPAAYENPADWSGL